MTARLLELADALVHFLDDRRIMPWSWGKKICDAYERRLTRE